MGNPTHDLARTVVMVDNTRIPGANQGDFLTIEELAVYATASAASGRSQVDRLQAVDRNGAFMVGPNSEAHRVLGQKWRSQEQQRAAGAFDGFSFSFSDPANGDTVTGTVLLTAAPATERGETQTMVRWPITIREARQDYGSAIPVGGGVLP